MTAPIFRNYWDTVSNPGLTISAGTLSSTNSGITFSNGNGVSFGYDGTNITASAAAAGAGSLTVSDHVTSLAVSELAFTNSNGMTMTLSTAPGVATLIASYTVPTITNSSWTVSDAATSATVGRLAFTNSNGLTLSLSTSNNGNHTVIGSYTVPNVPAATSWTVSDANTSATVGRLAFTNSNGLTLSLSTSNNGNHTVIGSYTVPTITNSSWTVSDSATSATVGRLAFVNSNGVSFGLSTSNNGQQTITATVQTNYLTTAALSSQTLAFSLGGNSATTNSSQILNGGYILAGGANVTIQQSNNTISIGAGAAAAPIVLSAGTVTSSAGSWTFSNSNNVSFGLGTGASAAVMTASASVALSVAGIANSQTTFNTGTVNLVEGGGAITIQSTTGQSLQFSVPQTSSIIGQSGISVSTNGSTISVYDNRMLSYWANMQEFQNTTTTMAQSNSFYLMPLSIPNNVSASYIRLLVSFNFTSTSIATSAVNNATGASTAFSETVQFNAVLYTVGNGGNSRSLQYVTSASAGMTWAASVSQASTSNASNQSITQAITFPNEGGTASISTQYSVSTSNGPISTTQWSNLSAQRFLDIPFAASMSAGNYWLALNRFSGTVGGKNLDMNATTYGVSQQNLSFGNMNSAANLSNCPPQMGLGVWTTNAANTTSSIAFASISATTSYALPVVQLIRQA